VDEDDEEARFWAQFKDQQRAAAAAARRQERDFRREWSAANGLCHLRVVGRRIRPSSLPSSTPTPTPPATGGGGRVEGRRRRAEGPGWEWHGPPGASAKISDADADAEMEEEEEDEEEHPSGTVRGYIGAPVGCVTGRGARLWGRGWGRGQGRLVVMQEEEQQQLQGEGEEEEVFARWVRVVGGGWVRSIDFFLNKKTKNPSYPYPDLPLSHTHTHAYERTNSHGLGAPTELLAIDRRPSFPSALPDPRLLALINTGRTPSQSQQGRRRGLFKGQQEEGEEGAGHNAADPAMAIAEEVAAVLATSVWTELKQKVRTTGSASCLSSRGRSKRLMEEEEEEGSTEMDTGPGAAAIDRAAAAAVAAAAAAEEKDEEEEEGGGGSAGALLNKNENQRKKCQRK
jgi:hypothetical protein